MAYGVSIQNSSGSVIINEDYSNYMVVATGTAANGTTIGPSGVSALDTDNIIWIRPHVAGGNDISWNPLSPFNLISSSGYFEWVHTKKTPTASSSTFGLRVKRSDGTISFDSGYPPVSPVMNFRDTANEASYTNNAVYMTTVNAPFSAASGRKRFLPLRCFERFVTWNLVGANAFWVSTKVVWTDENTFQVGCSRTRDNGLAAGVIYNKPPGVINHFFAEFTV